jgi:hypothetical protein
MTHHQRLTLALAVVLGLVGSGTYVATGLAKPSSHASGMTMPMPMGTATPTPTATAAPVVTTQLGLAQFGSFFASGHAYPPAWRTVLAARGQSDVYVVDNVFPAAGSTTGWHTHPGPSLILVLKGQVTNHMSDDRSCQGHTYTAGQGFIDPGGKMSHTLDDTGSGEAETMAVQVIPHGAARKTNVPNPTHCNV